MTQKHSCSDRSIELRDLLRRNAVTIAEILAKYGARSPLIFGSVARGDATQNSDIDLIVELDQTGAEALWELSGIGEELRRLLRVHVDVVTYEALREDVASFAKQDLMSLP